jgi:hypothetical protein
MNVENLTPMLRTWDLPGTIEFSRSALGFQCEAPPESGWATMGCGPVSLMLSGPNAHERDVAPAFTGSLYLVIELTVPRWA